MIKPDIKSFLIADLVIREQGSNKWSAIGIFDKIFSPVFPIMHPSLALYIRLENAFGDYEIKIEFVDSNGNVLAFFSGMRLSVKDRLTPVDFGVQTQMLPLPAPGKYDFRLYFNEELTKNLPLVVEKLLPPGEIK